MMDCTGLIAGADRVTQIFGDWPSFHDAEVLRLVLDRSRPDGPILEIQIHAFESTGEVAPSGYYVLKNHNLISMRFTRICLQEIKWFNHQNVLMSLDIFPIDPEENEGLLMGVEMPSSYGMEAKFQCAGCEVIDVQPFEPSA
jgi:hypothetical protein